MSTMNISLPDALKSFVDEQVSGRGFGTSSEYVRAGDLPETITVEQAYQACYYMTDLHLALDGPTPGSTLILFGQYLASGSTRALDWSAAVQQAFDLQSDVSSTKNFWTH